MELSDFNPVRIVISLNTLSLAEALGFALCLKATAQKWGGEGFVFRANYSIQIYLEELDDDLIDEVVDAYCKRFIKQGKELVLTRSVFREELPGAIIVGECLREPLTHKFLDYLPAGAWLVSNVRNDQGQRWTARIGADDDRPAFWKECQKARVANRVVWVVSRAEDAEVLARALPNSNRGQVGHVRWLGDRKRLAANLRKNVPFT